MRCGPGVEIRMKNGGTLSGFRPHYTQKGCPVVEWSGANAHPHPSAAEIEFSLRKLPIIVKPLSTESAKQMLETIREQGSAPADAVSPEPFIVRGQGRNGQTLWMVLYTDSRMLKPETYSIEEPVADALKSALHSELLTGVAFNTLTTIARYQPFEYRVDKLYLAGLIGYLTATDAESGARWAAANVARDAGRPYEVLHHALRSLHEKEDWAQCELAKLWAMWELDFPGSRAMALEELEWFIGEGHDSEEIRALLERFQTESQQP